MLILSLSALSPEYSFLHGTILFYPCICMMNNDVKHLDKFFGHLCVYLRKMSAQIFCPFLIGLFCIFINIEFFMYFE